MEYFDRLNLQSLIQNLFQISEVENAFKKIDASLQNSYFL